MKKTFFATTILSLLILFSTVVFAEELIARIERVNLSSRTLLVNVNGETLAVYSNYEMLSQAGLKAGDFVKVDFKKENDKIMAISIQRSDITNNTLITEK